MAPDKHNQPRRTGGELGPSSPSNDLVLSSDRPTRLENALQAFHDILTDDERKRLRAEMNVSCDAGQVIAFTAGLDVVDPNRRGRSIATRLHSILETVQRFSEVVGIYVSSHPEIAALVWGSVLANFTSFFQTFSELLNGFDTLLPQFKEYQVLFPDSLPLRSSVYDFHAALVSCCTQVISSTRRTWSQQAWASFSSSFESEIRPRVAEIREKAELVKGQAALAKAQDDNKQRKWSSLLLRLSSYDHSSAFNHARGKMHRGTAEWIFSTAEFQDWRESAGSSVLNVSGKIGSGKTMLAANTASHLLQTLPQTCSVSYLFVRFDDEKSRVADAILRSLIFQALTGQKVQNSLIALLEDSASHGFERGSLLSLLGHFISLLEKTFLIVDGLDQCAPHEQHSLIHAFSQLTQIRTGRGGVKILISARQSIANEVDRALAPTTRLRIGLSDTNADLAKYAEEILAEKRRTGQLVIGDETIMTQIEDKLRTGGEGMFLWVFLTIEDICSCPTDHDIRQTLEILPRKLTDAFNRALRRILSSQSSSVAELVQRTLRWVATVRRPMTRWELGDALGVKILQKSFMKDWTVNGTERLPGWCENLIHIEDGDETVRFFHHSIKTHLLDMKLKSTEFEAFHIDLKAWDHQVGEICLTYLNFIDFHSVLTEFSPDTNSLRIRQIATSNEGRSIPAAVGNHAVLKALPAGGLRTAAQVLGWFLKPNTSGENFSLLNGVSEPEKSSSEDTLDVSELFFGYPFLFYAMNFWLHHTFHFHPSTTRTWILWKDQVTKLLPKGDMLWASFGQQPPGFETFDLTSWLPVKEDDRDPRATISILKEIEREKYAAEQIAFHKAMVFADFIDHKALLTQVVTTIQERDQDLSFRMLEQLLPTRRVFRHPLERKEYIQDENTHDGLVSLVTEFISWGGPVWPRLPDLVFTLPCNEACKSKPLHAHLVTVIARSGYSTDRDPELQVFAKIALLKPMNEILDAVEVYVNAQTRCIHEFQILGGKNVVDLILDTGGAPSFKHARRVVDLHEGCVGGRRYTIDDWRNKLQKAIRDLNMIAVEFYLQESKAALAEEKKNCGIDFDLLSAIIGCGSLPSDFRSQAISVAIHRITKREKRRDRWGFENLILTGHWDIVVALSSHGLKLADTLPHSADERSWLLVLDDVLRCVSQPAARSCTLGWPAWAPAKLSERKPEGRGPGAAAAPAIAAGQAELPTRTSSPPALVSNPPKVTSTTDLSTQSPKRHERPRIRALKFLEKTPFAPAQAPARQKLAPAEFKPTLEICARHYAEARQAWNRRLPDNGFFEPLIFKLLRDQIVLAESRP